VGDVESVGVGDVESVGVGDVESVGVGDVESVGVAESLGHVLIVVSHGVGAAVVAPQAPIE
jgi:hypothetical protein